jgi:hypothetical protein
MTEGFGEHGFLNRGYSRTTVEAQYTAISGAKP